MNELRHYDLMIRPALCLVFALTLLGYAYADDGPSAFPVASTPKPLTPLMQRELRGCFDFFCLRCVALRPLARPDFVRVAMG